MNCSSLEIDTPEKLYIREKKATPLKTEINPLKRFSPSNPMKLLLNRIERVHRYMFHSEYNFVDLTKMKLTQKLVQEINKLIISEEPDNSDLVLKIEEMAVKEGKFNYFIKNYIGEEFQVDPSFSILILSVLNYMNTVDAELEESMFELLKLSSGDTLCELCIGCDSVKADKVKLSQMHNLRIYGHILHRDDSEKGDLSSCSEDSGDDKPFKVGKKFTQHPSSESSESDCQDHSGNTRAALHTIEGQDVLPNVVHFNPFDSSVSETSRNSDKPRQMNSTQVYNPFSESDPELPPGKSVNNRTTFKCDFCSKCFSNSYNRKLHLIRETFKLKKKTYIRILHT